MVTAINIDGSKLNVPQRRQKVQECASQIHQVINSTLFRDRVMKMDKSGETSKYKDVPNGEIYKMLMAGAEEWANTPDNEWDIFIDDYFSYKAVIGYMNIGKKWTYVNTKYFDGRTNRDVGSNIVHEYGHHLGFRHDFWDTDRRPYSICYQLNEIFEECHRRLIGHTTSLVKVKTGGFWFWKKYQWIRK